MIFARVSPIGLIALAASACSSTAKTDATYKAEVTTAMHDSIATELAALHDAAVEIQVAAPTPKGRGWDATQDKAALDAMIGAWERARTAYEHVEGAVAPIFPDVDAAIDARYDNFLTMLGGKGDADLFDGSGVTGMHAIERILFAPAIGPRTLDFEKSLPGYAPAAFPANEQQAADFKAKLCAQLITDIATLQSQWQPSKIDVGGAYQGLISLMNEQHEKVNKASTGEEESRYSQHTLADLHGNLEGTEAVYAIFRPWILSKGDGKIHDDAVLAGFQNLHAAYDANAGKAIPVPPATWSSQAPSASDLTSPFGKLFTVVTEAVNPERPGSVVDQMNQEAKLLGFAEFAERK